MYVLPDPETGRLLGSFAPILPIGKMKEMVVCDRQEMMETACLGPTCDVQDLQLDVSTRDIATLNDWRVTPVLQQKQKTVLCASSVLRNLRCEALHRLHKPPESAPFSHLTRYERLYRLWKDYCVRHSIQASEHLSSRSGRKICLITGSGELQVEGEGKTWAHARSQAIWKAFNRLAPALLQSFPQSTA